MITDFGVCMTKQNYSKQREAILTFLRTRKDHPTAEVIYENLRSQLPNISMGTVYRNLDLLAKKGTIIQVEGNDSLMHYDADTSIHHHFVCKNCGCIQDIYFDSSALLENDAVKKTDNEIFSHAIYFYGLCHDCKNKA